ncbi:MAG: hypothetical protein AAGD92_15995 [Pseudomonadota bacterium]
MSENNRPIETIRAGRIKASIWENQSESGSFLSVTFAKTYTDDRGKPRDTQTFSLSDVPTVAMVATRTFWRAHELQREFAQTQDRTQGQAQERDRDRSVERTNANGEFEQRARPSRSRNYSR